MFAYKNAWNSETREAFAEALALDLDEALRTAYVDSDRLAWIADPASVGTLDKWLELARGTVDRLTRERERQMRRGGP